MIAPTALQSLDATQVFLAVPSSSRKMLDHAVVHNPDSAIVYLNVWDTADSSPSLPLAAADRYGGPYAIGPGATLTIPLGLKTAAGAVVSATSATDATGAPGSDLLVTFGWIGG